MTTEQIEQILVSVPFRGFRGLQEDDMDMEAEEAEGFSPLPGF